MRRGLAVRPRRESVGRAAEGLGRDRADLVVVKGNPLTRIRDIENVRIVFKDGVGYDPARLIDSVRGAVGLW